jgi:hypothetical protein
MSTRGEEILLFQLTVFNREYRTAMPPITPRAIYSYMYTHTLWIHTLPSLMVKCMYFCLITHICPLAGLILIHLVLHSKRHLA